MKRALEIGGLVSGVVLIAFGIVSIMLSVNGRSTVHTNLKQEQIVGSADMNKTGIAAEAKAAGLTGISLPTCNVAGKTIDTGARARCFASYMRIHALEATGGVPYAQLPRFASADGKGTNDATKALKDAKGQPQDNGVRNTWITETALSTALNVSTWPSSWRCSGSSSESPCSSQASASSSWRSAARFAHCRR